MTKIKELEKLVCVLVLLVLLPITAAYAQSDISPAEAHAIGVDAYLYFYPLVTMDLTRRQSTNIECGKDPSKGPMNTFLNVRKYPPVTFKGVVRPNYDTLYSSAWLDLTKEPVIMSTPDTAGRYYMLPMLDMWTDVFAVPGSRTTGTRAGNFLVAPPGWRGKPPKGIERIDSPTPYVWIIGRTKTDGLADYEAVHKIQAGYKITPLSQWGKRAMPATVKIDPAVDMTTPPKIQADTMPAEKFFTYAVELMKVNPPHITDQTIIAQMRRIGIVPGKSLDFEKLDPAVRKALASAPADAQALMKWKFSSIGRVANNWLMNTDTMGVYGNYYLKRAIIAQSALGANLPDDAIYPMNLGDETGTPLDGVNAYILHFDKGKTPPVNAFWSLTIYDAEGFPVPNALDRYAVSSWMPFKYNSDGSLDIYLQNENPGGDKEANWLPAPKGNFNVLLRMYAPKAEALNGKWDPPPVKKNR